MKKSISVLAFVTTLFVLAKPAFAEVVVAKTAQLSIENVQTLVDHIESAKLKPEFQNIFVLKQYGFVDDLVLACLPGLPKPNGEGCFISISLPTEGFRISIRKPIELEHLQKKLELMKEKLAAVDVERNEHHHHVGHPFASEAKRKVHDNTHWYCFSEGKVGMKAWKCEVRFSEMLGH